VAYKNEDQRLMAKAWRSKAWKARHAELIAAHPRCEWCNGKSAQVNHKKQGWYPEYPLMLRHEVDVICKPCHKHFTETGQRRPVMYINCNECNAPIWPGRKVCFMCGGSTYRPSDMSAEKRAQLLRILAKCPEVKIGDVWSEVWVWGSDVEVVIQKFEKQDTLPWPMVKTDRGEVGLPAFMFGSRRKHGEGDAWTKLTEKAPSGPEPRKPRSVYLDRLP
jgi:hypothetical protein